MYYVIIMLGKISPGARLKIFTPAVILLAAAVSYLPAQNQSASSVSYTVSRLENGLTVILSEDYSFPVVTVAVTYLVGSAYDPPGQAGMAYFMENLMFQGSQNVGRLQHIRMINQAGGRLNALTTRTRTLFYQTVSSNQLPLVIWLESDRMKSLSFSPLSIEESKKAFISEIRERQNTRLFHESSTLFERLLYKDYSYYHPIAGEESGIRNIDPESLENFHQTYYRPNNAVLCVSGHFDRKQTMPLIRKYFESIPPEKDIPSHEPVQPPEPGITTRVVNNNRVSTPGFHLGFPLTGTFSKDFYTLVLIDYILLKGNSSRLRKRLVQRDKTALNLEGGIEIRDEFSAYKIFLLSNNEATKEMSKKALFGEINGLKSNLVPEDELLRAKNLFKRHYYRRLESPQRKALFLTDFYINHSGLEGFPEDINNYMNVTAAEIIGIMNRYFSENYILVDIKTK